ncbi:hypothetical protein [Tautonia sociabilis]|uniref:Uncharacterized protein n=1 Tax=Tautonia sociabilis TaxID=2080755 RepID=A0A432MLM4_9BACT|nr:hypothetical protein [Tautonia sociabilis]RUL88107.1 hypothetical protein TsocGM_09220 [Tautonia sociabilis]
MDLRDSRSRVPSAASIADSESTSCGRGIRLLDLMITTAAVEASIGFGIHLAVETLWYHVISFCEFMGHFAPEYSWWWMRLDLALFGTTNVAAQFLNDTADVGLRVLIPLTVAILLHRAVPPRPGWDRLAQQPGFRATAAASAAFLAIPAGRMYGSMEVPVWVIPGSVAASWLALAVRKRWAPESSWIDRAGRVVETAWLAIGIILILPR